MDARGCRILSGVRLLPPGILPDSAQWPNWLLIKQGKREVAQDRFAGEYKSYLKNDQINVDET
jgi:hypothetical protein